jgi:hypothetical protein
MRLLWTVLLLSVALISSAVAHRKPVRLDSSDWWSYTRQEEFPSQDPQQPINWQKREPVEANFQVVGIALGEKWDFSDVRSKFGEAMDVQRGDAASGRDQICYRSPAGNLHLIFELGEVNSVLYFFAGGPRWSGSEFCAPSKAVLADISTVSGLRLGLGPQQVKAILGDANVATQDKLVYYFEYRKKTSPEKLAQVRKNYPDMTDAEFHQNFEYADGEAYIEARFSSGKLNYLAISKSETY